MRAATRRATARTGRGSDQYGAAADDIVLRMPVGTIISDADTGESIAELLEPDEKVLIAKGGDGGFGNLHFKTSTNRAPRQKTPGWPGEQQEAASSSCACWPTSACSACRTPASRR